MSELESESGSFSESQGHPDDTVARVKAILRKKAKEKGLPVPPSPPPALDKMHDPIARQLLEDGGQVIYEKFSKCLIKHICGTKVTKMDDRGIRVSEVEALRFVTENTTIPVPRVHDVGERHITMDFIEGEMLKTAWDSTLSEDDLVLVRRQLRDYIDQMRAIKSPDGMICTFGGRPAIDSRLFLHEGGPFSNESDYNDFLVSDLHDFGPVRDILRTQLREGHEIVFSHGDLHAINILARSGEGIVAIVDWELAGFYP